jgi:hypothetical protein
VKPFHKLPIFLPAVDALAIEFFQGFGLVDGVSLGVGRGLRVEREGGPILGQDGESSVEGEIVWLNVTKYDEAISLVDAWFEDNSDRTKGQAFDERAGCSVDCWVYVGRN